MCFTSCCILGMKAAIRRKQYCLRRRALQVPDDPDPTVISSSSSTCSQSFAFAAQGRDAGRASKNVRALEFSCEFVERMCQRVIGYLCVSQLEALTHDMAEQLANVVQGVLNLFEALIWTTYFFLAS